VKIRGTAAHIAEKYMSLARDALASGDMVTAESYLQHAEHYNRIIMAAQTQLGPQQGHQGEAPNGGYRQQPNRWHSDSDEDADAEAGEGGGGDIRAGGGGGQDRERHTGDREHHPGRDRGRQGGNGREAARDQNGSEQPEAHQPDETSTDPVS
jgi:hypothetical protein